MSINPLLHWLFGAHFFDVGTVACICIGFSMALSANSKDTYAALWFFGIAGVLAAGRAAHWIATGDSLPLPKPLLAAVLFGAIGALWAAAHLWARAKLPPPSQETRRDAASDPVELPRPKLRLVIDSVTAQEVRWHIEPVSDTTIQNIRVRYSSRKNIKNEVKPPVNRQLSRGEKISILGMPLFLVPNTYNRLDVTLIYNQAGNNTQLLSSTSQFFFFADTAKTVLPEAVKPTEILTTPPEVQGPDDAQAAFVRSSGTISLVLNERSPEGKPNIVSGGNQARAFVFDPILRIASFQTKFPSGASLTLKGSLKESATGNHHLMLGWDEAMGVATFSVDGVDAKQLTH